MQMLSSSVQAFKVPHAARHRRSVVTRATKYDEELVKTAVRFVVRWAVAWRVCLFSAERASAIVYAFDGDCCCRVAVSALTAYVMCL